MHHKRLLGGSGDVFGARAGGDCGLQRRGSCGRAAPAEPHSGACDRRRGGAQSSGRAYLFPSRGPGRDAAERTKMSKAETGAIANRPLDIVILGLSITSSWGNGHATTYRGLVKALAGRGHRVLFLEHDAPWYARNRDMVRPPGARVALYHDTRDLIGRFSAEVRKADVVIIGSYTRDGIKIGEWLMNAATGVTAFYDIDTPVTLTGLENGSIDYLSRELAGAYDLYLSFTGGPTLDILNKRYGARMPRPLYCSADPDLYYFEESPCEWDLGYMGTYSADRAPALRRLLLKPAR